MLARLEEMKEKYEIVGDVRGLGMMIAIEFVKDKKSKDPSPNGRDDVTVEAFNNGLLMLPTGFSSLRIIPPITINQKNLEEGMDILEDAIKKVNFGMQKQKS
jgi:4-aminobutyrate aminotransferase